MQFNNPYWSEKLKISTLQRWIIVNSILYYEMNETVVPDKIFDRNARQLVALQNEFEEVVSETDYGYVFYDFDGTTGFDLYDRLDENDKSYLTTIAFSVLRNYKEGEKSEQRKKAKKK